MLTAFVGIYLLVHIRAQQIAVPHWRAERGASADMFGFLEERLSGLKDIRSLGAIAYVMRRFHEVIRRAFWTNFKANVITDVGWTISNLVFAAGYVVIMVLGAHLFLGDVITIGTVYLILHYLQMLRAPLNTIRSEIEDLQRVKVSIERVKELTDTQPTIQDGIGESLSSGALSVAFQTFPLPIMRVYLCYTMCRSICNRVECSAYLDVPVVGKRRSRACCAVSTIQFLASSTFPA